MKKEIKIDILGVLLTLIVTTILFTTSTIFVGSTIVAFGLSSQFTVLFGWGYFLIVSASVIFAFEMLVEKIYERYA